MQEDANHFLCGPHDKALVIFADIQGYWVEESSSIMEVPLISFFGKLAGKMNIAAKDLRPVDAPLTVFTGVIVYPLGAIQLSLTMGMEPRTTSILVKFLVVDLPLL